MLVDRKTCKHSLDGVLFIVSAALALAAALMMLPLRLQAQAPGADQSPAPTTDKLEFDVVSIRAIKPGELNIQCEPTSANGWCGRIWADTFNIPFGPDDAFRPTGGYFTATAPAVMLVSFAYKITTSQRSALRASAPKWALDEPYQIKARTSDPNVTKDQMRAMVRSLLADRFHLVVHTETRETPVFAVVLAKPGKLGPNLRPHPAGESCSSAAAGLDEPVVNGVYPDQKTLPGGFPVLCGTFVRLPPSAPALRHEGGRNMAIATIATAFTGLGDLGRPAVDQTGLKGAFDWWIEYEQYTNGVETEEGAGPSFREALQAQLGLKLKPEKAPYPFLVIDHIERPAAN